MSDILVALHNTGTRGLAKLSKANGINVRDGQKRKYPAQYDYWFGLMKL